MFARTMYNSVTVAGNRMLLLNARHGLPVQPPGSRLQKEWADASSSTNTMRALSSSAASRRASAASHNRKYEVAPSTGCAACGTGLQSSKVSWHGGFPAVFRLYVTLRWECLPSQEPETIIYHGAVHSPPARMLGAFSEFHCAQLLCQTAFA